MTASRRKRSAAAVALLLACSGRAAASSSSLTIRSAEVRGNKHTKTETILHIARVWPGKSIAIAKVDAELTWMKSELITAGLFSEVEVSANQSGEQMDIIIQVHERWTWFLVPGAAFGSRNVGGSLTYGETNLRGQGERLILHGALTTADSRVGAVYDDPSIRNTWFYGRLDASLSRQAIDEFNPNLSDPSNLASPELLRTSPLWSAGFGIQLGRELTRHWRVELYYRYAVDHFERPCTDLKCSDGAIDKSSPLLGVPQALSQPAGPDGSVAYLSLGGGYDSETDLWGVKEGTALLAWIEGAHALTASDFEFLKAGMLITHGHRFFREHNLIVSSLFAAGIDLPFDLELEGGGSSLRGYPYRQFRGDTQATAHLEYVAPLFKVKTIDFRGVVFYDSMAIWFRQLHGAFTPGGVFRVTHADGNYRDFVPAVTESGAVLAPPSGLDRDHWHNAVGGGFRVYWHSINLPLVGLDVGYGLETGQVNFIISAGIGINQ